MTRLKFKLVTVAIVVLAMSAVASSASAAPTVGPLWKVNGVNLTGAKSITLTTGRKVIWTKIITITCEKGKLKASGAREILGTSPGAGKATLVYEECTSPGCEVKTVGASEGTIEIPVNFELVFPGKSQFKQVDIVFKTTKAKNNVFAEFEAGAGCILRKQQITATGSEQGSAQAVEGMNGLVATVSTPLTEQKEKELALPETPITHFLWENPSTHGFNEESAGFDLFGERLNIVADYAMKLDSGESFSMRTE